MFFCGVCDFPVFEGEVFSLGLSPSEGAGSLLCRFYLDAPFSSSSESCLKAVFEPCLGCLCGGRSCLGEG